MGSADVRIDSLAEAAVLAVLDAVFCGALQATQPARRATVK